MDLIIKNFEDKKFHLAFYANVNPKKLLELSNLENILLLNADYVLINFIK